MSFIQSMSATTTANMTFASFDLTLQSEAVENSWAVVGISMPGAMGMNASVNGLSNAPTLNSGPLWHGSNATSQFWVIQLENEDFGKTITVTCSDLSRASVAAVVVTGMTPTWGTIEGSSAALERQLPTVQDQLGNCVAVFSSRLSTVPSPTIDMPNPPYADQVYIATPNDSGASSSIRIGVGTGSGGQNITHTGARSGAAVVTFAPPPSIGNPEGSLAQERRGGQSVPLTGPYLWTGNSVILLDDYLGL